MEDEFLWPEIQLLVRVDKITQIIDGCSSWSLLQKLFKDETVVLEILQVLAERLGDHPRFVECRVETESAKELREKDIPNIASGIRHRMPVLLSIQQLEIEPPDSRLIILPEQLRPLVRARPLRCLSDLLNFLGRHRAIEGGKNPSLLYQMKIQIGVLAIDGGSDGANETPIGVEDLVGLIDSGRDATCNRGPILGLQQGLEDHGCGFPQMLTISLTIVLKEGILPMREPTDLSWQTWLIMQFRCVNALKTNFDVFATRIPFNNVLILSL